MDPYFQLNESNFRLKGLDRKYTVLHISDLHLMESDELSTEEERAFAVDRQVRWEKGCLDFARVFGDDTSEIHRKPQKGILERFLNLGLELQPDAVVITGDCVELCSPANYRHLQRTMKDYPIPVLLVRGNHEYEESVSLKDFYPTGDCCRILKIGKLELIAIDDSEKKVSENAFRTLKLEAEASQSEPILCMHVPIRTEDKAERWGAIGDYFTIDHDAADPATKEFVEYLTSPDCPLGLVLCGHIHGRLESHISPKLMQVTASAAMLGCGNLITFEPTEY